MNKNKTIILAIFTIFIATLLLNSTKANIIEHHVTIDKEAISRTSQSSAITAEILQYEDYYHLGNELTDISVVGYFTIDAEPDAGFFTKLFKFFTFRIGKTYRATHSQNACLRALSIAETPKQRVVAYGLCSHLIQDAISHNQAVPPAIKKTRLYNGVVHSIKEIHDSKLMSNSQDKVYSRQILDLAYEEEIMSFLEEVFVEDPALSQVNIRHMVDFFVKQVQPYSDYKLGFRSFFALPQYVYWVILFLFLASLSIAGLSVRRIRDGQRDIPTFFIAVFSGGILFFVSLAIYGLATGTVWSMWEVVSQYLFSPASYFLGIGLLAMGGFVVFRFITKTGKMSNLGSLPVALMMLMIGGYIITLPTSLTIGNEQALHTQAVEGTVKLLTQGVTYVRTIQDPVGYNSLKEANDAGYVARTFFLVSLIVLFMMTLYFTFKRKKK